MKIAHLISSTVLILVFISCSKNSPNPVDTPAETESNRLKLVKFVSRRPNYNFGLLVDSLTFTYDNTGKLKAVNNLKTGLPKYLFTYKGDSLATIIFYPLMDTIRNPVKYLDGGNTIVLDYTMKNPNSGYDTTILTYTWSGDNLVEQSSYIRPAYLSNATFLKYTYGNYQTGNPTGVNLVHIDGISIIVRKNMTYDDKKNYFREISKLEYILCGLPIEFVSRSINNLVRTETVTSGTQEYICTYNADGYLLTKQLKGNSYLSLELTYNK